MNKGMRKKKLHKCSALLEQKVKAKSEKRKVQHADFDFHIKKEGHFIMMKETVYQEDITLINMYALNQGAPK